MTEEEYIALIITSIGGDTADGLLAANLPTFWALHASAPNDATRALLTKIDGLDLLLGQTWRKVDFKALDGASVNLSDLFDHLLRMRQLAQDQIDSGVLTGSSGGAVGELLATAPIDPPSGRGTLPDANDRAYRGDPYRSRKRRGVL